MLAEWPYLMDPSEVVSGYVFGQTSETAARSRATEHPRIVLEAVIAEALRQPPCGVAFSGGRDSSLVLAVAAHVGRREGLPEPIPITRRFPGIPQADEDAWQEQVVRHLGLAEWHRIEIRDELDVIGPLAARHLTTYGVVWPPAIAGDVPLVEAVPGGTVLDGEGGDQVLGAATHRIAPIASVWASPRPLRRNRLKSVADTLIPGRWRARRAAEQTLAIFPRPWLRPLAVDRLVASIESAERARPLAFDRSVLAIARRRGEVLGTRNRQILARANGVSFMSPLLDPRFVGALADHGGFLGSGDRTMVLRALASDLLPDDVLSRTSKAAFNTCYMTTPTRDFARLWTGEGVDDALVDCEELQRVWLAEWPLTATAALLQTAWLASADRRSR